MAEIVEVKKQTPPIVSATLRLSRGEMGELVAALDHAQRGQKYWFTLGGGRSAIAIKLEAILKGKAGAEEGESVTLPKYQDAVSSLISRAYDGSRF